MEGLLHGDYGITPTPGAWTAWQSDLPEKESGAVTVFRRAESPYCEATFELTVRGEDRCVSRTVAAGNELKYLTVRLEKHRTGTVIEYRKVE